MERFWATRVHTSAAKHLSAMQTAHLKFNSDHHTNMEGLGGRDDDTRAYFPCPYCYIDTELRVLCSHLQEEHCFDLKNAVCPLCAANLGKDALGHFTTQHAHSVKRKRKSQKSGYWNNWPTIGKDWREVSSFLGSSLVNGRGNTRESAPDPLLSPFLCNVAPSDTIADQEDKFSSTTTISPVPNLMSTKVSKSNGLQEQDYEERGCRAAFVQELIVSALI